VTLRHRPGPSGTSSNIIVIDDDEIVLQAISDLLEAAGHHVHALVSPIGATQVIATQGISLAVIDLNMPIMRGDRFISLVRSWDRIRDLPVVLISGEAIETVRSAASQLRGVTVVTKAEMNEKLVPTVAALLRGSADAERARPAATSQTGSVPTGSREEATLLGGRPLSAAARATVASWRDFASARSTASRVTSGLASCRIEAQQQALPNIVQLLTLALEVVGSVHSGQSVSGELDQTMTDLLGQLAHPEMDKLRAYDRSLALTVHRSRLERARSL
jgi:CheY-like chemotaxis protein